MRIENIHGIDMLMVFKSRTVYHGIAVVRLIKCKFVKSSLVLGALVLLPNPASCERCTYNDGEAYLVATQYLNDVALMKFDFFLRSPTENLVWLHLSWIIVVVVGVIAECRGAESTVDEFAFRIVCPFRQNLAVDAIMFIGFSVMK